MKLTRLIVGVFISSFLIGILLANIPNLITCAQANRNNLLPKQASERLFQNELCELAKSITVKVLSGNTWGSGILVGKKNSRYSLITNGHVLKEEKEFFTVETHDSQQHSASLLVRFDHGEATGNDLAILQFDSPRNYQVATLAQWSEPEKVMAAGFPLDPEPSLSDNRGFMCTPLAEVFRKLDRPMQKGYQLGYFLSIRNGMSGGPLFNDRGQVVGINGMGDPAIFSNPDVYLYRDGSRVSESINLPSDEALELLATSSWAIPSEAIIYYSPDGLDLTLASSHVSSSNISESEPNSVPSTSSNSEAIKLPYSDIKKVAEQITVSINRSTSSNTEKKGILSNSGVIVGKNKNKYYVLTRNNLLRNSEQYEVLTPDSRKYQFKIIEQYPNIDLAILELTATEDYTVANLGDLDNLDEGSTVYVASWNNFGKTPTLTMVEGKLLNGNALGLESGLVYISQTSNRLISGVILDQNANLIGIHRGFFPKIQEGIPISVFRETASPKLQNLLTSPNKGSSCDTTLFGNCSP